MIARLLLAAMLFGCTPSRPLGGDEAAAGATGTRGESMNGTSSGATGESVANLPFSHGKSFRTLDDYLAHLQRYAAPVDQPWWREIRPGVYEHVKRMPGAKPEVATRAELMKRFGFTS